MTGFIKVNKHKAYAIWVNVSHIVYLYDNRIVLDNGKTEIVDETASEMIADIIADIEAGT